MILFDFLIKLWIWFSKRGKLQTKQHSDDQDNFKIIIEGEADGDTSLENANG